MLEPSTTLKGLNFRGQNQAVDQTAKMPLEPLLWLVCFLMNMGLMALNIYQYVTLSDLEADCLNTFETSSRINSVVIPEFLFHGAFCFLFLLTGHWFFFLLTLLPAYLNARRFLNRRHLIDVTEVFRTLDDEKQLRVIKLGFYFILFIFIMIRLVFSFINSVADEDEALHFYGLF